MEQTKDTSKVTLTNISFLTNGQIEENIDKMASHMKFFSIFNIVQGVILCFTIVGAIIGIPVIIYHLKLNKSARSYRRFAESSDFFYLHKAFEDQRKFFLFYKILLIVMLIFFVIYIGVMVYLVSLGIMSMPQNFA